MQIPALLHGSYKEVRSRCQKNVSALAKGASFESAFGSGAMLDTTATAGLLVLDGPSASLSSDAHFQCFLPLRLIYEAIDRGRPPQGLAEAVFHASLQTPWSLLGLLAPNNARWLYLEQRLRPTLEAVERFWNELTQCGRRYTNGSASGQELWPAYSNLQHILARLGAPTERLTQPLTRADLSAWM